jgi:hypothetical protein
MNEGVTVPGENANRVVVTDVHMPFWSMVTFMVKWAFAAIPAMIILFVVGVVLAALFGGVAGGIGAAVRHSATSNDEPAPYMAATAGALIDAAPTTNVPKYAERCKGSPDVDACIAIEKRLADETPEQRKARQQSLEGERVGNMAKVH